MTNEPTYRADLRRARQALVTAELADTPADRFLAAHLAALRVAAALLGVTAQRTGRGGPVDVWQVLVRAAPEYAEWATFFAATRGVWQAVSAGARNVVTERQADDLLRDATTFCDEVSHRLDTAWRQRPARTGVG
ncbi:MAG TPA: SAV_6107 family HEPN domain-containing protein [Propionibacteriaceae bacterium]|nr:SAV_6107 family HEPN domain-containing protein [Propionibacteriaceae bacterium]